MVPCPSAEDLASFACGASDDSVARHLDACSSCAVVASVLRQTTDSLDGAPADHDAQLGAPAPGDVVDRYVILRCLGRGGMGVVYEAYDRERDLRLALKTLPSVEPTALYRFKREFRALADVTHPNLVTLYELAAVEGRWFFTMELLDGVDFLSHVRGRAAPARRAQDAPTASVRGKSVSDVLRLDTTDTVVGPATAGPAVAEPCSDPADEELLRPALIQLVQAIATLHETGHVHRDVKPSNILVTREARVVVLDFGIITEIAEAGHAAGPTKFMGTPSYAAPETVSRGVTPTPASDWYSVGVILYEALTGQRPFVGTSAEVFRRKRAHTAVPPGQLRPGSDPDLEALCTRLLARDPTQRPAASEILSVLHRRAAPAAGRVAPVPAPASAPHPLVGRERQLRALHDAFEHTRAGRGAIVHVHGPSGMGKSAVVEHFLAALAARSGALILSGRCYERESVPYGAIDSLVDALAGYLVEADPDDVAAAMPPDRRYLGRVFPVLRRVEAIEAATALTAGAATDPLELRRRAFAALRDLLARLAERRPVVLHIDDLQWGDEDSAPFLAQLMRAPTPPLLFLAGYRDEHAEDIPALRSLRDAARAAEREGVGFRDLAVNRLPLSHARDLAAALLRDAGLPIDAAQRIARESEGNPFLVHEFVRFLALERDNPSGVVLRRAAVISARLASLSGGAQKLMHRIAVAGRPLDHDVLSRAASLGDELPRALAELRSASMVRSSGARRHDTVETYHDSIREVVTEHLDERARRTAHRDLARALAAREHPDHEALAGHCAAAGEHTAAVAHAVLAGDAAADTLAFERAAAMYRLALELLPADDRAAGELAGKLGDALSSAGRGVEAARAYQLAVELVDAPRSLDLRVKAGSALLRSGRVDEGIEVLRPTLAASGMRLATTPTRAVLSLLAGRLRTRLRGLRFRARSAEELSAGELNRIDTLGAAAGALGMVDTISGADIQTRHLRAALRAGEPLRVGRALAYECAFSSLGGPATATRTAGVLATLNGLALETHDPLLHGLHEVMSALAAYQCGDWRACRNHAALGELLIRDHCRGAVWEQTAGQLYLTWALFQLGELDELATRARGFVREARERGDLYAEVSLCTGQSCLHGLATDAPEQTMADSQRVLDRWARDSFDLQNYWGQLGLAQCELYAGDPRAALARTQRLWRDAGRAFMLRIAMVNAELLWLLGRCALAAAVGGDDTAGHLRLARRCAARLARSRLTWCRAASDLLRAGITTVTGASEDSIELLHRAESSLRDHGMAAVAAAAARLRGVALGGDDGRQLVADGEDTLRGLGVRNPARMASLFAPGG